MPQIRKGAATQGARDQDVIVYGTPLLAARRGDAPAASPAEAREGAPSHYWEGIPLTEYSPEAIVNLEADFPVEKR